MSSTLPSSAKKLFEMWGYAWNILIYLLDTAPQIYLVCSMRKTWNKHEGDVSIGRFRQQASLWRSAADFNWFLLKMFQKQLWDLRYHCNYKSVLSYKKHQQIKLQTRLVITQVSVDQIKLDSIWHFRVEISSYIDVIDIDLVTARRSIDIFRWGRPGVNILRTWEYQDSFGSSSSRTFSLHSENPFPFPGSQIFLGHNPYVLSLVFSCPMRLLAKPCGQQYVGQYCARQ